MISLRVDAADIQRMLDGTILSYGPRSVEKISRYWILLALSGIIATAGVATDSTATVIGAMIVAPLMTPILGTAFALVLADYRQVVRALLTVFGGALLVVSIGFLFGMLQPLELATEANSQVSGRVHPRLVDLIAALATGSVGAFALVRSDVSDTLPGVAIAISLVPPLAVAGLTLEAGNLDLTLGALLLFLTNVVAIIFTATMGLLLYRVRDTALDAGYRVGKLQGWSLAMVIGIVIVVAIPLGYSTQEVFRGHWLRMRTAPLAEQWAQANNWKVIRFQVNSGELHVAALGRPPGIRAEKLREALDEAGFQELDLSVQLVVGGDRKLPGRSLDAAAD